MSFPLDLRHFFFSIASTTRDNVFELLGHTKTRNKLVHCFKRSCHSRQPRHEHIVTLPRQQQSAKICNIYTGVQAQQMLIEMQDFDGNKTRVVINSLIIGTESFKQAVQDKTRQNCNETLQIDNFLKLRYQGPKQKLLNLKLKSKNMFNAFLGLRTYARKRKMLLTLKI